MKSRALFAASLALFTLALGLQAQNTAADSNPDLIEARKYTLTMDKINKLADAMTEMNKLLTADPTLKQKMDAGSSDNMTIDQKAKYFDASFPLVAAVIHSHGLTTREFIVVSMAFINDVTFVGMKKQGMIKDYPPNSITAENAAFVEANFDKLQLIGERLSPPQN